MADPDVVHGTDGNDTLTGHYEMYGEAGDDILIGGIHVHGGTGNDRLVLNLAYTHDVVVGSMTADPAGGHQGWFHTGPNMRDIPELTVWFDGIENFTITGGLNGDHLTTGDGDDVLDGDLGGDTLTGGFGNDTYMVDSLGDTIVEAVGGGSDTVWTTASYALAAGAEVETLSADYRAAPGPLNLIGNGYGQAISGNGSVNFLNGNGGADVLAAGGGDDAYLVDWLDDAVLEAAGGGTDTIYATGHFSLTAGAEVEVLLVYDRATTSAINFNGNEFGQAIYGNAGTNVIDGKGGNDTIYLMGGTDTVYFSATLGVGNVDAVLGFASGDDKLQLDSVTFAGLAPGALPASAFALGAAGDADDRVVYDQGNGLLWFDADGNGAGAAVLFATLDPGTLLAASDFVVV